MPSPRLLRPGSGAIVQAPPNALFSGKGMQAQIWFSARAATKKREAAPPRLFATGSASAIPPRIADPLVILPRHTAFVRAVAVVAVGARVGGPTDDAGQVGDEAAQHGFRGYAVFLAHVQEFVGQA